MLKETVKEVNIFTILFVLWCWKNKGWSLCNFKF